MPCKHEGGTDECETYVTGACKAQARKCQTVWRQNNPDYNKRWKNDNYIRVGGARTERSCERGTASELFVESEFLRRGLLSGRPSGRHGKHDLFVRADGAWHTVQVKTGLVGTNGHITLNKGRKHIVSDLIAVVDLDGHRVAWIPNNNRPLPAELGAVDEMP